MADQTFDGKRNINEQQGKAITSVIFYLDIHLDWQVMEIRLPLNRSKKIPNFCCVYECLCARMLKGICAKLVSKEVKLATTTPDLASRTTRSQGRALAIERKVELGRQAGTISSFHKILRAWMAIVENNINTQIYSFRSGWELQ